MTFTLTRDVSVLNSVLGPSQISHTYCANHFGNQGHYESWYMTKWYHLLNGFMPTCLQTVCDCVLQASCDVGAGLSFYWKCGGVCISRFRMRACKWQWWTMCNCWLAELAFRDGLYFCPGLMSKCVLESAFTDQLYLCPSLMSKCVGTSP